MLVVCRRWREAICIETPYGWARIQCIELTNGKIRVGIEAPKEVLVLREELVPEYERTHRRPESLSSGNGGEKP